MSEAINRVKIVKVKDSRIEAIQHKDYAVIEGGQMYTLRPYEATSMSASSMSFSNINPPSSNIFVNKVFLCKVTYDITLGATGLSSPSTVLDWWGSRLGPRCMPLNNSLINLNVQLNSGSFSQDQNDILLAMTRINFRKIQDMLSPSPNTLDNAQSYAELVGANLNPLGTAQTAEPDSHRARGGFPISVISNTNTSAHFTMTVTEPLMLSPLDWDNLNSPSDAFIRLTTCSIDGVFDPLINLRVLSCTPDIDLTSVSSPRLTSISVVPTSGIIMFQYITPPVIQSIPPVMSYPYYQTTRYVTQNPSTLASGVRDTYPTSNLQLKSIPKKIILFVKQQRSTLSVSSPDVFARIEKVSVNFMNQTLLSTATPEQLYSISKRNGVDMEYSEWYPQLASTSGTLKQVSGPGSILVMQPVTDWGLPDMLSSGASNQTMLNIQVDYTNVSPDSHLYSLYLLVVDDGAITLSQGSCLTQTNIVGINDLINQQANVPAYTNTDALVAQANGGNFFTDIKAWFSRHAPAFKEAFDVGKQLYDVGKQVAPIVAPLLGLGGCCDCGGVHREYMPGCALCEKYHASQASGVVGGRKSKRAAGFVGGKMLPKKKLAALMM